jgi:hypothetical protein
MYNETDLSLKSTKESPMDGTDPKITVMKMFSDLSIKDITTDPTFFTLLLSIECGKNPHIFDRLLALLSAKDPTLRMEASRILSERPDAMQKVISLYTVNINKDPYISVLAGRVVGRKLSSIVSQQHPIIHGETTQIGYGTPIAFAPCICGHCGSVNDGIPVPEKGLYIGYYGQSDDSRGVYSLPVLCDFCSKIFFIAWDVDPRH